MKLARWMNKAKAWIFTARDVSTPWRVAPVLVVGTVLAAGAAVYLNMAFGSETGSPSYEQQRVADSIQERMEVQRVLQEASAIGTAEGIHVLPEDDPYAYLTLKEFAEVTGHSEVDGMETVILPEEDTYANSNLSESAGVIERLERRIARLLAEAARDPAKNTPQLNREIERLDAQIDMLRHNSMQEALGNGSFSRDQGQVVSDRPYLGTEYHLDSAWQPFGSLLPDTEYYRDPDYNERHMRSTGK